MNQEEVASEKLKTDQGEKATRAPYAKGNALENEKHQIMKQTRFNRFSYLNCNMPTSWHGPQNDVVVISKSKKNTGNKSGEKIGNKD